MQKEIINKYGKETIKSFWIFVENLSFDSKKQDSSTVRASILKKLSPSVAEKYKDICDELAFSLYKNVFYDKKNIYLYAAFESVSKGEVFYQKCWDSPETIETLVEGIDQFNNFSSVLPIEGDYFVSIAPSTGGDFEEEFEDYDEFLDCLNNKKEKKSKNKKNPIDNE